MLTESVILIIIIIVLLSMLIYSFVHNIKKNREISSLVDEIDRLNINNKLTRTASNSKLDVIIILLSKNKSLKNKIQQQTKEIESLNKLLNN